MSGQGMTAAANESPRPAAVERLLLGAAGAVLVASAFLPWLTLFGGLKRFPGLTGPAGVVVLLSGAWLVLHALEPAAGTRRGSSVALLGALIVVCWSWTGVLELRTSPSQRMLVPATGLGLPLAAVGLVLGGVALLTPRRRSAGLPFAPAPQ